MYIKVRKKGCSSSKWFAKNEFLLYYSYFYSAVKIVLHNKQDHITVGTDHVMTLKGKNGKGQISIKDNMLCTRNYYKNKAHVLWKKNVLVNITDVHNLFEIVRINGIHRVETCVFPVSSYSTIEREPTNTHRILEKM